MASGTVAVGKSSYFRYGDALGSALVNDVSLRMGQEEIDISAKNSDWKAFMAGQSDLTLDVSGIWDAGTNAINIDNAWLWARFNGGGTVLWEFMPQGSASSRILYKGNGFPTSGEISSPLNGRVGFAMTIRASDTPARSITA